MNGERNRPRFPVMLGQERKGAWTVERLSATGRHGSEKDEPADASDKASTRRHQGPEQKRDRDNPLAREPVTQDTGERSRNRERTEKRGIHQADLQIGQTQFLLDRYSQQSKERTIRLMEEIRTA